eukprot:jgi/Botrbrau1/22646/Bobra.176_1s0068.1
MKVAATCLIALCLCATVLARVEPGRTLLQSADALKAACPEYSSFYGTSSEGLDDCAIRSLSQGQQNPTAACCAAAQAFVNAGAPACDSDHVVISKAATLGCPGFEPVCGNLGECATK